MKSEKVSLKNAFKKINFQTAIVFEKMLKKSN